MNYGFGSGRPPAYGMSPQETRLQELQRSVDELRDIIEDQYAYADDLETVICGIEEQVAALLR